MHIIDRHRTDTEIAPMRVDRTRSRSLFRRSSGGGCLPFVLVICLLLGMGYLGRDWLTARVWQWWQPPTPQMSLAQVQRAFANGDLDEAVQTGRALLAAEPDNLLALEWLARTLVYRSYVDYNRAIDRERALALTQAAYERHPSDPRAGGIHAYVSQANGNTDEAYRLALRVIARDETNLAARLALSLSYSSQGIFEAGRREAQRGVELAADAPHWKADAYRVLALAYSDLGRYNDAATHADTAITLHRRLIPLHFERALYAMQVGDTDTATAHYFNVIALDDENVKARLRLCDVSSKLSERLASIAYCQEVTKRAPGWAEGWYQLGREYFLKGDFSQAKEAFGRCSTLQVAHSIPIAERRIECWYLQGQAAEVVGDCETLLRVYDEFRRMDEAADLTETWTYPPGGPVMCATETESTPDL